MTTENSRRRPPLALYLFSTAFECFVLAEILWYYLHDGDETLHSALWEWSEPFRERAQARAEMRQSMMAIRDLPETEEK